MKNKLMSIGTMIIGVLLAAGPQFLFKVCPVGDKPMKCFYTAKALIAARCDSGSCRCTAAAGKTGGVQASAGYHRCGCLCHVHPVPNRSDWQLHEAGYGLQCADLPGYPHPVGNRHRFAGHPLFCKQGKGEIILETVYHPEDGGQKLDPQTGA